MMFNNKVFSIWLIGPSAAGKTTISKLLYNQINKNNNLVLIDGDQVRNLYENNLGYDIASRSKNTQRYLSLVNWLFDFNISSIVAVISPLQKDRILCRKKIKNYFEIHLKSSREERIKRDKKDLYKLAIMGKKKNVVDVDIPFEDTLTCDLEINTENKKPEEIVTEIIKNIN